MATKNPAQLLDRLCQEPNEFAWLEFKVNNSDPDVIGRYISACANAAILDGKERGFLVFGVEDRTRKRVGTDIRLDQLKKGGENFPNWISRMIDPKVGLEILDFEDGELRFAIICIEPAYERPVKFAGNEYIRFGENVKKLAEYPERERALWFATGRRKFEDAVALPHQTLEEVLALLDVDTFYKLVKEDKPQSAAEIIRKFCSWGFIKDDMEGAYDITNLGAILFADDISLFSSIKAKSVRIVKYVGRDKEKSDDEQEGRKGYAIGFSNLIRYIMAKLPREEKYVDGVRTMDSTYPEVAVREIVANALIHQDFTVNGSSPMIELYSDRIEVINPGNSLIEVDRIIDERRSRNEKLASTMRHLGLCEERGGGLDKAIIAIERKNLPAPDFNPSENSMRVILFGPRPFSMLSKAEKTRACFFHCVIRWLISDYMSNTSLRERFSLEDKDYQAASGIISEAVKAGRIAPAEDGQGNRNARYVPYWVKERDAFGRKV